MLKIQGPGGSRARSRERIHWAGGERGQGGPGRNRGPSRSRDPEPGLQRPGRANAWRLRPLPAAARSTSPSVPPPLRRARHTQLCNTGQDSGLELASPCADPAGPPPAEDTGKPGGHRDPAQHASTLAMTPGPQFLLARKKGAMSLQPRPQRCLCLPSGPLPPHVRDSFCNSKSRCVTPPFDTSDEMVVTQNLAFLL